MTTTACQAKTLSGQPCRAYALTGSRFCFAHEPARAKERRAARARGGRARHGRQLENTTPEEFPMVENVEDVIRLLTKTINDALRLENSLARARTIASLASTMLKALEVGDIEQRLAELESRTYEHN